MYRVILIFFLILIYFIFLKDEMKELYDIEMIKKWLDFVKMMFRWVFVLLFVLFFIIFDFLYLFE